MKNTLRWISIEIKSDNSYSNYILNNKSYESKLLMNLGILFIFIVVILILIVVL